MIDKVKLNMLEVLVGEQKDKVLPYL